MNKEDLNCFSELMMLVSSFDEDIADSESMKVAWNKFDRFCKDVEALREADKYAAASRWQQTDERQYVQKISDGLYKLVEARHDTDRYIICMGDVSIKDWIESDGSYSDDCRKIISQYYSSVQNFEESYEDRNMREQVLAEILFEETCHTLTDRWEYVPDDLQAVQEKLVDYMTSI